MCDPVESRAFDMVMMVEIRCVDWNGKAGRPTTRMEVRKKEMIDDSPEDLEPESREETREL